MVINEDEALWKVLSMAVVLLRMRSDCFQPVPEQWVVDVGSLKLCRADFANQVPPRLTLWALRDRDVWISEFPRPQHSNLTTALYGFENLKKKSWVGLGFFLSPKCIFLGFGISYNCGLVWSLPFSQRRQHGGGVSAVSVLLQLLLSRAITVEALCSSRQELEVSDPLDVIKRENSYVAL